MLTLVKLIVSALLIYIVNDIVVSKSRPFLGSLIASLPLVSLITLFWIHFDLRNDRQAEVAKLAAHSTGVFWFVLPSLPMFLLFPWLLKKGITFWPSIATCCVVTMILYAGMAVVLRRFGMDL